MKRLIPALAAAAMIAGSPAAMAMQSQDPVADLLRRDTAVGSPDVYDGPADETPRDPYDPELGVTAELNADIAARDREIAEANARAEADYRRQEDDYVRRLQQQEADFAAAQAAYQDALSRQQADHAAAMDQWRRCAADRRACTPY